MAITDLVNRIVTEDQFSQAFDSYNKKLDEADSRTGRLSQNLGRFNAIATTTAGVLAGAAAGIKAVTDITLRFETAATNVAIAVQAANNEFGESVGTLESWQRTMGAVSRETRIFGDVEVRNATARLLDMTKRLGLSEQQMQVVLRRTADVSAGKVGLADGIERVTAGLRGEAEAAELLSLSLNETTIRAYAEAQGLVFKNLTDVEKAGLRYEVFLQQTNALQGRAAEFANTRAGREAALANELERQADILGQQLLPLRERGVEALARLAGGAEGLGFAFKSMAALIVAAVVTAGAQISAFVDSALARMALVDQTIQRVAGGESLREAFANARDATRADIDKFNDSLRTSGDIFRSAFMQAFEQLGSATVEAGAFGSALDSAAGSAQNLGSSTTSAMAAIVKAVADAKQQQLDLVRQNNQRIANLEFQHGQRMVRLQEDVQRTIAEAVANGARARADAIAGFEQAAADITAGRQRDRLRAEAELGRALARLNRRREDEARALRRAREQLDRDEAESRQRIAENFGRELVAIERRFKSERERLDEDFSSEFADADAFRRKILEFNRQERLRQLGAEEAAERTSAETKRDQQLAKVEDRISRERAMLEEDAAIKRQRLEQERSELRDHHASQQAERDRAAAEAQTRLAERHAAELAAIDEQEAQRIGRAQLQLENERRNFADRLAALRRDNAIRLTELGQALASDENLRRASYARQLLDAIEFRRRLQQILSFGGGSNVPGVGFNPVTGQSNTINIVNQAGAGPGAFANALQIGRSVLDAIRGGA